MQKLKLFLQKFWMTLLMAAFLPVYVLVAFTNERNVDYLNNGFFTFWLSGRFVWLGKNPYISADWVSSHHVYGATWIPNNIFPYPLPLALLMAPFGGLPLDWGYILWDILAQVIIGLCILWFARRWSGLNRQLYAVFLFLALVLNGNVYLGLMTGTFAALFLGFCVLAMVFMENNRPLLAGVALTGLALKPPLLMIVGLIGIWLLIEKKWRVIAGIIVGGLGWFFVGLLQDPGWVQKFLGVGESLLNKRLGNQPTILSYTRLACAGDLQCAFLIYALIVVCLIALFAWLIWQKRASVSAIEVFASAVALGVLLPPYLWSYDYTLLVIPISYISFELIARRETYLHSTLFLLFLDVISIIGMVFFWLNPASEALTIQRDMWSIWVGVLVLVVAWWMIFGSLGRKTRVTTPSVSVEPS